LSYETIRYETSGRVCFITMNRPEVLNACNDQMAAEMNDAWFSFDADPNLDVAVVSGAGRAFSSGADVRQRHLRPVEERESRKGRAAMSAGLRQSVNWKPVIAAVHGHAVGAGFVLMQLCDLAVVAEGTTFKITEVGRGIGGSHLWSTLWFSGAGRFANEVALTGRQFSAEEAASHGLVNRLVPAEQLLATASALAEEVAANPPLSVRCNSRVIRHFLDDLMNEASYYQEGLRLHFSEDFREAARAFVEKREPVFIGR
jgi:enoyl-CoA hydratase/carnithine racemase